MRGVTKQFPGTLAVDHVDFRVKKGEVHALMGENGAGKSTLMKVLAGLFNDYTGEIYIDGEKKELHTPVMAKEAGIGMVYQELSLARRISIFENMLAGRLPKKNALFIDKKAAIEQARKSLERVGLGDLDPTINVSDISQCDAQLVEIAKVLDSNPKILVMDEPTSSLSSEEVERMFAIIRKLKAEGLAIVYISHHMAEIFEIADSVTVMRDGKKVGECPIGETNEEKLVEQMVGEPVKDFYAETQRHISDEVVLKVEDFTRWGFFHHVNFELHKGEVLAISGLAGAGRTEIAKALIGVDEHHGGKVYLHGKEVNFKNFGEAIKAGIGYVTEDRKVLGLALTQSVADNVLSCVIDKYSHGILYSNKWQNDLVDEKINDMSVYPADRDRLVNSFSGGNQQKVLMAKWLAADVDVLILDEPTRGVDVNAKQIIHNVVKKYVEEGHAAILISSDLPEVVGLADRAVILREGHIIGEIPKEGITENSLLIAANGKGEYVTCQK
ncbi:MAG TPA: sugar ABC transporter ATP-binding protein [Candidatus Scatomonas merdavium]|nr:sugar ABC transporter ATP-binding protein [Candidatus Scatomonas merdavium]